MSGKRRSDYDLARTLLLEAKPYWLHLACILLLNLLSIPIALLAPLPVKIGVDSVIGSKPVPHFLTEVIPREVFGSESGILIVSACLLLAIALVKQFLSLGSWVLQNYTGEKLALGFRAQLFRHVQRLSLSYHDTRGSTESVYRIQYDAPAVQWFLTNGIVPFLTSGLTLLSMLYVMVKIDAELALVALAVAPVLFLLTRASGKRLRDRWYEVKKSESSAMSVIQEALGAVRVVKAFGQEEREKERYMKYAREGVKGQIDLAIIGGSFNLFNGLAIAIGTASVLFLGIRHVQGGILTLGELFMVFAYLSQLYAPMEAMTRKVAELQSSLVSADRAFSLLDEAPDVTDSPFSRRITRAKGSVSFQKVSFGYDEDQLVLRDISFEVSPGIHVGIMGATGAGKTTLVSLLTRFCDPKLGRILIDDIDLREYRLDDVRNQFALVLQDAVLFSTSVAENIAYARPGASRREIIDSAKAANAHQFILELPNGYDTLVGERGMRLSGGERQRISLARAFLKDAPILVLDEPTSSVDMKTEAVIMEAMGRLMVGRTTFMIAHRLRTLQNCDLLLGLENGRLVTFTSEVRAAIEAAHLLRGSGLSTLQNKEQIDF